jgi:hypothetical protein
MKYRKLRIAWSVWWGAMAALLCVLWVRSYWSIDRLLLQLSPQHGAIIATCQGGGVVAFRPASDAPAGHSFVHRSAPVGNTDAWSPKQGELKLLIGKFGTVATPHTSGVSFPLWFPAAIVAAMGVAPWMRWTYRFSLRTLLLATTAVAVTLGLIIYAARG